MDADLIEMLSRFGALGLASGFIGWLYVRLQHRLDEMVSAHDARLDQMVDKFQGQIREIQERHDAKEAEIRAACEERVARFDSVVEQYNKERDTLLLGVTTQLGDAGKTLADLDGRIEGLGEGIKTGLAEMRQHYAVLAAARDGKGTKC